MINNRDCWNHGVSPCWNVYQFFVSFYNSFYFQVVWITNGPNFILTALSFKKVFLNLCFLTENVTGHRQVDFVTPYQNTDNAWWKLSADGPLFFSIIGNFEISGPSDNQRSIDEKLRVPILETRIPAFFELGTADKIFLSRFAVLGR